MPANEDQWTIVSNAFNTLWNFPQCVGVMDGKHITLQAPKNSGSEFFNYKQFFSIVLFVVANANYEVIYMNVGSQGRISDGGVFANTRFKKMLLKCQLHLPPDHHLPGRTKLVPHVFLGDDAFPLSPNLLKPFPGHQEKGSCKRIFNYRLSRARRISENVFGIMSAVFRLLRKPLLLAPEKAEKIVTSIVCLHNFLKRSQLSKQTYAPSGTFDTEDKDTGKLIPGTWRNDVNGSLIKSLQKQGRNSSTEAKNVRQEYADFFISPQGLVPWQNDY